MSFFPDIYDEATTHTLDDVVDPPIGTGFGGLPPLGAGIAGINTPSRKLGQGAPGKQPHKKFGEFGFTKGQIRDIRAMIKDFGLKSGDVF